MKLLIHNTLTKVCGSCRRPVNDHAPGCRHQGLTEEQARCMATADGSSSCAPEAQGAARDGWEEGGHGSVWSEKFAADVYWYCMRYRCAPWMHGEDGVADYETMLEAQKEAERQKEAAHASL